MIKQKFFYLNSKGRIFGPITAAQLRKMYQAGRVTDSDTVSADKINWQSAGTLFASPQKRTPSPGSDAPLIISSSDYQTCDYKEPVSDPPPANDPIDENDSSVQYSLQGASAVKFAAIVIIMFMFLGGIGTGLYFYMQGPGKNISFKSRIKNNADTTERDDGEKHKNVPPDDISPANTSWSAVIDSKKDAVGVVFVEILDRNKSVMRFPQGTAWAIGPDSFATNAHVINSPRELYKKIPPQNYREFRVVVVTPGATEKSVKKYPITEVKIHPQYNDSKTRNISDFAILRTGEKIENYWTLAGKEKVMRLSAGTAIAFLGFPMENLHDGNLNFDSPVATFQPGSIVAVSDEYLADRGRENNIFIRHNLPTVGGASGSPIFTPNGEVVAILFAGNMNFKYDENGQIQREPSAAQINFGIRIDRIRACIDSDFVTLEDFLRN